MKDLFASIISKFRGKVMLVDFWANLVRPPAKKANEKIMKTK